MPKRPPHNLSDRIRRLSRRIRRRTRSRSVLELLLFGFILVGAPLVVGLVIAGHQIRTVTSHSEHLFERTTELNRISQEMARQLVAVERAVRQYRVLHDDEAAESLARQREGFHRRARTLMTLHLEPELQGNLESLLAREALLAEQVLGNHDGTSWPAPLAQGYRELESLSRAITDQIDALAERDLERLSGMGQRARTTWLLLVAMIVPLAVGFGLVFTALINRPVRQLDQGIRALARAQSTPIEPVGMPRDLRALSVRLEWARRRLHRMERDRQRLLGQVSHELKTPLSAIREGASLLDDQLFGPLNEQQKEVLDILQGNAARLQDQIDSLLRYNQLRGGVDSDMRQTVVVEQLVGKVLRDHGLELTAREMVHECRLEPGLAVTGNEDMLETALDNLVSNAIKYSGRGGRMRVSAYRDGGLACIEVADRGSGIPAADRHRLFEPFYRGRSAARGNVPGSGLGLSICRDLVNAHGGDVTLDSRPGWSSVFRICLPIQSIEEVEDEH
jgi:two-component system, NtrC family, sensor histidine kinase GlrK